MVKKTGPGRSPEQLFIALRTFTLKINQAREVFC